MVECSTSFGVDFAALLIDGKAILVKVFNKFPLPGITLTDRLEGKKFVWKEASEIELWEMLLPVCTFSICGTDEPHDL